MIRAGWAQKMLGISAPDSSSCSLMDSEVRAHLENTPVLTSSVGLPTFKNGEESLIWKHMVFSVAKGFLFVLGFYRSHLFRSINVLLR